MNEAWFCFHKRISEDCYLTRNNLVFTSCGVCHVGYHVVVLIRPEREVMFFRFLHLRSLGYTKNDVFWTGLNDLECVSLP